MTLFFLILFLACGLVNFAFTIAILRELAEERRGLSFFDLRWYVLKNLGRYKELTRSKDGRVGLPYYGYLGSFAALLLALALLLQSLAS